MTSPPPYREYLADVLNWNNITGPVVEIGVHRAEFSCGFLDRWRGTTYYAVDPWFNPPGYEDPIVYASPDREADYRTAVDRLSQYGDRIRVLRMTSEEAAAIVDGPLAMVYVDADHRYETVLQDLRLWYRKVGPGGIVAGHDADLPPVRNAVNDLLRIGLGLRVQIIPGDAPSWYVTKPMREV